MNLLCVPTLLLVPDTYRLQTQLSQKLWNQIHVKRDRDFVFVRTFIQTTI